LFSDGHGIAVFSNWFCDLAQLDNVDWNMVYQRYWADNLDDMDRQRRKQAEFLVHRFCSWAVIDEIAVIDAIMKRRVKEILKQFPAQLQRPVNVRPAWYY
jgi:Tfp pilus assembly protein PilO